MFCKHLGVCDIFGLSIAIPIHAWMRVLLVDRAFLSVREVGDGADAAVAAATADAVEAVGADSLDALHIQEPRHLSMR